MRRSSFRKGSLAGFGRLVNNSLEELGLQHKIREYQVVEKWADVVGPHIAASSAADKVWDGILYVCCKSSAWSNELSLHKEDIIKKLNSAVGKKIVLDIRFSAKGFAKASQKKSKNLGSEETADLEAIEVDSEVASKVAAIAPSEDLADKIREAIITSKRLTELKRQEGWKTCPKCSELHKDDYEICNNCR